MTVQHCRRQKEKVSLSIILNPLSSCISLGITTKPDQIAPFPSQCRAVISDVHTHQTLTSLPKEFQTDRVISYVVKFYFWSTFSSISNEVLFSKAVLPPSAESKLPDKYSPLLYMVKTELNSAGCSPCVRTKGKKTVSTNLPDTLISLMCK